MKRLLSLSLFLMMALLSFAYDFVTGGIYYNITSSSDLTVAVTYKGTSSSQFSYKYTGDVTIPATVIYSGKTYSVTSIGNSAFSGCSGLTSITIPNSVTSIGEYAFEGCSGLKKVIVPDIAAWCNISFATYYANPLYYAKHIYSDKNTEITDLVIPNGVTTIGIHAFYGCSGLISITIPNSVTSIGDFAFSGCSGLTSITNPNSVTSIGRYAFAGCSGLTSIEIPNSVTNIGDGAFEDCSGLTSITIPNSVTRIGWRAFYGTAWYDNLPNGLVYAGKVAYKYKGTMPDNTAIVLEEGTTGIANEAFSNCSGLTSMTIPNSVTSIGRGAFAGCSGLTSIIIPNSVTSIGYSAFSGCSGLTSVTIPNSVTTIGYDAFMNCSSLTSITIPNGVTSIGGSAFKGCSGLTSITIPNSVTSIGRFAFSGCSGLTSVTIPNSVTTIGDFAFSSCSGLTSVTIPNSVTSIGYDVFVGCSGLKKVIVPDIAAWCNISFGSFDANPLYYAKHIYSDENTEIKDLVIPNSVTSIGNSAFRGCSGLTSVTIPNSVTSIGSYAFYGCRGLKEITSYIQKPFKTGDYCWDSVNKSIPLYVPAGTKEKYQGTDGWKEFTNIKEVDVTGIEAVAAEGVSNADITDIYDLNGRRRDALQPRVNIVKMSDGTTRKVIKR